MEEVADRLASANGRLRVSVGRELSAALLVEPRLRRPQAASRWMETRLEDLAPDPVLCTDIDLLFEPSLTLDPLVLLRRASRITQLVVMWPGSYSGDTLMYAVPEHSDYRTWQKPGVTAVPLEQLHHVDP